jgi:hypothetical protein
MQTHLWDGSSFITLAFTLAALNNKYWNKKQQHPWLTNIEPSYSALSAGVASTTNNNGGDSGYI